VHSGWMHLNDNLNGGLTQTSTTHDSPVMSSQELQLKDSGLALLNDVQHPSITLP
jgi:hypothetical protein